MSFITQNIFRFTEDGTTFKKYEGKVQLSLKDINSKINNLKQQVSQKDAKFSNLKAACIELLRNIHMPTFDHKDTPIIRARPNFDGEIFRHPHELSYNKTCPEKSQLNRFNLGKESIFYGSPFGIDKSIDSTITTITESFKELLNDNSSFTEQYFTIGMWIPKQPIILIPLSFYENASKNCPYIKGEINIYNDFFKESFSKEDYQKIKTFLDYFSECACKKNDSQNNYLLTTAFFHAAQECYGKYIGIQYSSSMTENRGLNIALTKEVVDRDLRLERVTMYKAIRDYSRPKGFNIIPCSNVVSLDDDNIYRLLNIT